MTITQSQRLSLADWEHEARQRLPKMAWDYFASGARDQRALERNRQAFDDILLWPRVLVDVSERDLRTQVLGRSLALPILAAPTAFQCLAHPVGESGVAKAAAQAGTVQILSSLSTTAIEKVAAAGGGPLWFQLYVYRDREATLAIVERAEAAGAEALVVTVDAPVIGCREQDVRNGFHLPEGLRLENLPDRLGRELDALPAESSLAAHFAALVAADLTWDDLDWLREATDLPLLVKGVLRVDDAKRARDCGIEGLVVSNHGGRQLDVAPAPIEALPRIADAVGDDLELLVDGGIRRGSDVLKALALGAKAVLVGRPLLWGLAVDGAAGATAIFAQLAAELDEALALCGCPRAREAPRDLIQAPQRHN